MSINYKIVAGVLAAVVVYDEAVGVINARRFKRNAILLQDAKAAEQRAVTRNNYYVAKLNENKIRPDAFDRIVMNDLKNK